MFSNSAHSPLWEESGQAIQILVKDVLQGGNRLADKQGGTANPHMSAGRNYFLQVNQEAGL